MILVLSSEVSRLADSDRISVRTPTSNESVLEWVSAESFERVVVLFPTEGINPFALSRSLKQSKGPRLVLAGDLHPYYRYWAERNGCLTASNLQAALETK